MREHARQLLCVGLVGGRHRVLHRKATQSDPPVVGDDLNGRAQIERAELWIGGDRQRHMAAVNVLVFHAKALGAEQEGHALIRCTGPGQLGKMLSGRTGGWAKVARGHGRGT